MGADGMVSQPSDEGTQYLSGAGVEIMTYRMLVRVVPELELDWKCTWTFSWRQKPSTSRLT